MMRSASTTVLSYGSLVALLVALGPDRAAAQFEDTPFGFRLGPAVQVEEAIEETEAKTEKSEQAKAEAEDGDIEQVEPQAAPIDPRVVRFHLMDGSVISGALTVDQITLSTEFGDLVIPVTSIRMLRPGLESYPQISEEIETLIENLASEDYKTRDQAHKDLVKKGLRVVEVLKRFEPGENAEQDRHVKEILKELQELQEEQQEFSEQEDTVRPYIREDSVQTHLFTALGRISPQEFTINSKYGPLRVQLSDVRYADRETGKKEPVYKSLTINGTNLVQLSYKSSGIRVNRGDKITVTAEGQMVMAPWGSNSVVSPDGGANFGFYVPNKIPVGAVVARIGSSGEELLVGSKFSGEAKRSGVLHFGVAMQAQYARQGYSFPGQYTIKVKVEPQQ